MCECVPGYFYVRRGSKYFKVVFDLLTLVAVWLYKHALCQISYDDDDDNDDAPVWNHTG